MSDLEVRQLRYFVAVAEELHFGRAAQRLTMAQPPLSRAIKDLETQLGVRLFERTTRQVALTVAGENLLRDARIALDAITAAAGRARHAGSISPTLRLALKADFDAGLLPHILAAYRAAPAALPVDLLMGGQGDQLRALHEGRADVALLPTPFDDRDLDTEPLFTAPCLVALAANDPLAARESLSRADLTGRFLPDGTPAYEYGLRRPRPAGPTSPIRPITSTGISGSTASAGTTASAARSDSAGSAVTMPSADAAMSAGVTGVAEVAGNGRRKLDLAQLFNLVELGELVWFLPQWLADRHPRPGIAYRPMVDLPPMTLTLAWPQVCRSAAVAAFARAAIDVAKAANDSTPPILAV